MGIDLIGALFGYGTGIVAFLVIRHGLLLIERAERRERTPAPVREEAPAAIPTVVRPTPA